MNLRLEDVDLEEIVQATVLWTTGTALSDEPSRSTTLAALARRHNADPLAITIHDLDHRPMFWAREEDAREQALRALASASVAVGNLDEVAMAVGRCDPPEAARRLLELGPELAVIKRGPDGVYARSATEEVDLEPVRLEVVNGVGAGDAFGGALAFGLVRGLPLAKTLALANASGALVASRLACADAMPELDEIESVLAGAAVVS